MLGRLSVLVRHAVLDVLLHLVWLDLAGTRCVLLVPSAAGLAVRDPTGEETACSMLLP